MHPSLPSPLLTSPTFFPASTHTGLEGMSDTYFHSITLKKKISQLFALLSCAKVASALWKYERPWVIFIFSKGKSAKEHFSISGRRKRSKSACLKCSLGKGKNELPVSGGVATAPRFISAAPGVQDWETKCKTSASAHILMVSVSSGTDSSPNYHSWWCLSSRCELPLWTVWENREIRVHSLPLPSVPAVSPRYTCWPCWKLVPGVRVPFFCRSPQFCI